MSNALPKYATDPIGELRRYKRVPGLRTEAPNSPVKVFRAVMKDGKMVPGKYLRTEKEN